jgi:hypothetical protein
MDAYYIIVYILASYVFFQLALNNICLESPTSALPLPTGRLAGLQEN